MSTGKSSNRATGQYLRKIARTGSIDPLTLLAIKVIDQAVRDAENCMLGISDNMKFQPGLVTPDMALEAERQLLLD